MSPGPGPTSHRSPAKERYFHLQIMHFVVESLSLAVERGVVSSLLQDTGRILRLLLGLTRKILWKLSFMPNLQATSKGCRNRLNIFFINPRNKLSIRPVRIWFLKWIFLNILNDCSAVHCSGPSWKCSCAWAWRERIGEGRGRDDCQEEEARAASAVVSDWIIPLSLSLSLSPFPTYQFS